MSSLYQSQSQSKIHFTTRSTIVKKRKVKHQQSITSYFSRNTKNNNNTPNQTNILISLSQVLQYNQCYSSTAYHNIKNQETSTKHWLKTPSLIIVIDKTTQSKSTSLIERMTISISSYINAISEFRYSSHVDTPFDRRSTYKK